MPKQKNYPECEKLQQVSNTHQTLNEFVEWLYDNGYEIKHYEREMRANRETIIYDFMGVDAKNLEKERRGMIASVQAH